MIQYKVSLVTYLCGGMLELNQVTFINAWDSIPPSPRSNIAHLTQTAQIIYHYFNYQPGNVYANMVVIRA